MREEWLQDILDQSPVAFVSSADMQLMTELYNYVQMSDLDYLRKADLSENIPYARVQFMKRLVLRWNLGQKRFRDRSLQEKLQRFMSVIDDLDLEFFKQGKRLNDRLDQMSLLPEDERGINAISETTRHHLAEIRSLILLAWQQFASLERTANARLFPDMDSVKEDYLQ